MLSIAVTFPGHQYHATPWDRQVNEGEVEWPPAPWRLLRALLACYYRKAEWEFEDALLEQLVTKLSEPPLFDLPRGVVTHTRHFMPLYRDKTAMIFDTFVRLDEDARLIVTWPTVELTDEEEAAFDILIDRLGYLGRAESWIEAERIEWSGAHNCMPLDLMDDFAEAVEHDHVSILGARSPGNYTNWRDTQYSKHAERRLAERMKRAEAKGRDTEKVKLTTRDRAKLDELLPPDLYNALHAEISDLKKAGWSQPPGSQWVTYMRPADIFSVRANKRRRVESAERPTVARFALGSQVPPRLTEAISLADRIHSYLVKYAPDSPALRGTDDSGKPLKGHRHVHIFSESNLALGKGRRGEITHVTLYAPMGFGREERRALERLVSVWDYSGHDIQLVLLGLGQPEDFGGLDLTRGECPVLATARHWVSRTPFVPTRHPKFTRAGVPKRDENGLQRGSPTHDFLRLLRAGAFTKPIEVREQRWTDLAGHKTYWLKFRRERKNGNGRKSTEMGYGFRLTFAEPVRGPIALGYGAHFGLGLFVPVDGTGTNREV